ncbi:MAG: hypothetical protein QNJ97_08105 [Myxococcota bacterium]|nr:hypothetical protein [Myxococcota bacterium]
MKTISRNKCALYRVIGLAVAMCIWSCGKSSTSNSPSTDSESSIDTDTGSETDDTPTDIDSGVPDAGEDTDSDTGSDTTSTAGQPCWSDALEETYGIWHPNYNKPECTSQLKCIGDNDESWCTKKCEVTGVTNQTDEGLIGWCCGQLFEPCDPTKRFWLPASMDFNCIPLVTPLAAPCEKDTEWTGDNQGCAPVCDGTVTLHKTICAEYEEEKTFCTYRCDPINGDADCQIEPAFESGCCGEILGGYFCLIPELCT